MKLSSDNPVDPGSGVALASVATSFGQPGGHVLTEEDVPQLLTEGSSFEEVAALQLTTRSQLEEIACRLIESGSLPAERFTFER
jgi:hypothetical protein